MNQGLINRAKDQIKKIEAYLTENRERLSQEDIDEALDEINKLRDYLEMFD